MRTIMLVEDDESLGETLSQRLKKDYHVVWAQSCKRALEEFKTNLNIELVILDVGLPDGTGFELADKLKAIRVVQFLFLTAQADAESRLKGFELGAEEFIPKPFHLRELLMRIEHIFKIHEPKSILIELSKIVIDFNEMSIRSLSNQSTVRLPVTEFKMLKLLIERSPNVVSRDEIIDSVWGIDKNPSHRTVDNMILHLRQLLAEESDDLIRSVRGIGYQWIKRNN